MQLLQKIQRKLTSKCYFCYNTVSEGKYEAKNLAGNASLYQKNLIVILMVKSRSQTLWKFYSVHLKCKYGRKVYFLVYCIELDTIVFG